MKKYTASQPFAHGGKTYKVGDEIHASESTGEAMKAAGLAVDYIAPAFSEAVRAKPSASRPVRVSQTKTSD